MHCQLSNEQLGKIARLHMQDAKEHEKIKEKMHKSHHAFRKAKMQPGTEDVTLRKLGKVYADAFTAMVEYHIKERKAVHDILTLDQMEKLLHFLHEYLLHSGYKFFLIAHPLSSIQTVSRK
jgi:hypothetical protein